jgi:hypothetical protein
MGYNDFKKDFPKRTIDILNRYSSEEKYDVTLLLNCLLALLVFPKEKFYNNIPEEIPSNWGLSKGNVKKVSCESCGYKLKEIVRHMRNAIAHMKIETTNDSNGNIEMVKFKDLGGFELEISVSDLKTFVTKLVEHVIECKKDQQEKLLCSK